MNRRVLYGRLGGQARLNAYIRSLGPAAWFRMDQGVTVTGAGISQVDDLSGNARHLLDPGTTRPIYLPYSGTKYLYLPGVAGNYASTPDSAALSITGDIDIAVRVAANDWSPSSVQYFVGKISATANRSFYFQLNAPAGLISFNTSPDGSAAATVTGMSNAVVGATDGATIWVRVTLDVDDGAGNRVYKFYTAADSSSAPSSWTQLGTTVTTAGATSISDTNSPLEIGSIFGGTTGNLLGKVYRVIIKDGIDGTTVVDFNPADASDGATSFASSATGETWTVNSSGGLPAQIVGRAAILFNGTSHYLKTAAFTLNQPNTIYLVANQISWTNLDYLWDGNALNQMRLIQTGASPNLAYAATTADVNLSGEASIGTYFVVAVTYNAASSAGVVNAGSEATGNPGAASGGGFTLGAAGSGLAGFANIAVKECAIFPAAHDATTRARIISGLMARHGVA